MIETGLLSQFQKEVSSGVLEVLYEVKEHIKKKQMKQITPLFIKEELRASKESLGRSVKQKKVIDYFIEYPEPIERSTLLAKLSVSSAVIKGLIEKGILSETSKEVYRDPYANRLIKKTEPHLLTEEQSAAILPILTSLSQKAT